MPGKQAVVFQAGHSRKVDSGNEVCVEVFTVEALVYPPLDIGTDTLHDHFILFRLKGFAYLGVVFFQLVMGGGFLVLQVCKGKLLDFIELFNRVLSLFANTVDPVGDLVEKT